MQCNGEDEEQNLERKVDDDNGMFSTHASDLDEPNI